MSDTAPIRATVYGESRTGPLPVVGKSGGRHRAPATPRLHRAPAISQPPVYYAAAVVGLLVLVAVALAVMGVVT